MPKREARSYCGNLGEDWNRCSESQLSKRGCVGLGRDDRVESTPMPDPFDVLRDAVSETEYDVRRLIHHARDDVFLALIQNLKERHERNPDTRFRFEQVMAILKDPHDKDKRARRTT